MRVLMISSDAKIFEQGSPVRRRMIEYGSLFDELHIVVFTKKAHCSHGRTSVEILSDRVRAYQTCSYSRYFYCFDALRIASRVITSKMGDSGITIITTQDPFETGIVGKVLAQKYTLPLNVQVHTDFLSGYFRKENVLNRVRVALARFVFARAASVRVVSRRIKISLEKSGLLNKTCTVSVLPIFVDIQKIKDAPVGTNLKAMYPQFDHIVLMASRLTHEKDIHTALHAFIKVLAHYPRTGLVIVGDGPERDFLSRFCEKKGIHSSVVYVPWMNRDDLYSLYKTADVFLLSSLYEGYGMTLVEAGVAGTAIVSTDVGVASELLSGGVVCPPRDAECLAHHVLVALKEPQNYRMTDSFALINSREVYLQKYKESLLV